MTTFTSYEGTTTENLVSALLAQNSGVEVNASSILLNASGSGAVNYYDGSLTTLGIGAGVLLTSGTIPGEANTVGWFGSDNSGTSGFSNGDANIDAVVNTVFSTASYDATTLQFDFTVTDPNATSVSFDVVFGSDEFPEWVDQFVDCAVVIVNGVNYALFNHDPSAPLSVIGSNLAAGYFQDNSGNTLQIEYDGVSQVLKIVAPILAGQVNTIKIGIADTGDHIYDSGLFISNLAAGTLPGSGVLTNSTTFDDANDTATGTLQSEIFDMQGGDDTVYAAGGDDIVVAGAGADFIYGGSGDDVIEGDSGDDVIDGGDGLDTAVFLGASSNYTISTITGGFSITDTAPAQFDDGSDTLKNVEFLKFSDGLFQLLPDGTLEATDAGGGTPANTAGTAVIDGISAPGNTLIAHISDADGLSGDITYSWQMSVDGGQSWDEVGTEASYVIDPADVGALIEVRASYTDDALNPETIISTPKTIHSAVNGDLKITLMVLDAPTGATVMTPFTTLIKAATDLGLSPNTAEAAIKAVLGLPSEISLLHYDAYAELQSTPSDTTALHVELVAVEIAILTSLSDDDHGYNLALDIIALSQVNGTLDLANADDLAQLLGVETGNATLNEILDRNQSMASDIADGKLIDALEKEWQDFLSIQDDVASTSIADLSVALNSAPVGYASAQLAAGETGTDYTLTSDDLLAGFSDPNSSDTLIVGDLSVDSGSVTDNNDGTFTLSFDAGFSGPVEISYTVNDGNGGVAAAKQLVIIASAAEPPPAATAPVITSDGGGDSANLSMAENSSTVTTVVAGDADPDAVISYSIVGGADADLFQIDATTGALSFIAAPDFESPSDSDLNNEYSVDVCATTAQLSDTQTLTITVTNQSPETLLGTADDDLFIATSEKESFFGNGGIDTVSYALASGAVTASLASVKGAKGFALGDTFSAIANLTGSNFADSLTGDGGNNVLDGGAGADKLAGGAGDDTYIVGLTLAGKLEDSVKEAANSGIDTLVLQGATNASSAVTISLAKTLENLDASETGASLLNLTGNALANTIVGNDAANMVTGGALGDTMDGKGGSDLYVLTSSADYSGDLIADSGTGLGEVDQIRLSGKRADSFVFQATTTGIEQIVIGTGTGSVAITTGKAAINVDAVALENAIEIIGNNGNNTLTGTSFDDTISGGLGNDTLTGGAGADHFVFNSLPSTNKNVDTITDFTAGTDQIALEHRVFSALAENSGAIDALEFVVGKAALEANDRLIYDPQSGNLYYDSNGSASGGSVQIAHLQTGLSLTEADFFVF